MGKERVTVFSFIKIEMKSEVRNGKSENAMIKPRPDIDQRVSVVMGYRSVDVTNVTSYSSLALSVKEDTNKNGLLLHWELFQRGNEKFR